MIRGWPSPLHAASSSSLGRSPRRSIAPRRSRGRSPAPSRSSPISSACKPAGCGRLLGAMGRRGGVATERARLAEESATRARGDERTRLAREIHGTLAQGLTAIALQIETAIESVGRDPDRVRARLEKALATARENLDEARRSVTNLRAGALAGKPLAQALASLAREFTSDSGIRVTFEPRGHCSLALPVEAG